MHKLIGWVLKFNDGSYGQALYTSERACLNGVSPDVTATAVYTEPPPESLTIRDEAELRILAGLYTCPNSTGTNEELIGAAKRVADLWMKARTA